MQNKQNIQFDNPSDRSYGPILASYKNNPSYTEILHYLIRKERSQEAFANLKTVLTGFMHRHAIDIGYSNDLFDLAVFLLMFMAPHKAYKCLCYIYENFIPEYARPNKVVEIGLTIPEEDMNWF